MSSETAYSRHLVMPYVHGNVLDIGSGGDPIVDYAVQIDLPEHLFCQYGHAFKPRIQPQLRGVDFHKNLPFKDGVFDTVFSSHLLEDYNEWEQLLSEWLRVVRIGGRLIIMVPDKVLFNKAVAGGQSGNGNHKHEFYVGELSEWAQRSGKVSVERDSLTGVRGPGDYNILFVAVKL